MLYFVFVRFIKLQKTEQVTLENGYQNHPKHHFRQRCHALLLSHRGKSCPEIANLFNIRTRTVYTWMDRWESQGLVGLMIQSGRGLKPILSISDLDLVDKVKKSPSTRS